MNPTRDRPLTRAHPEAWEAEQFGRPLSGWRRRAFIVIFESNTPAGKAFDLGLLVVILASVAVVMLDSVQSMSVAPTYLAFFFPGLHAFIDIRLLRVLRVFRILKITAYMTEYSTLGAALWASRRRIVVFVGTVLLIVVVMGTLMYMVEGPQHGFTSIPVSIYWAITTMTTVGYGDITPQTGFGRLVAGFMMLLGWGTLAVPTGIVTAEITARRMGRHPEPITCTECGETAHLWEARYCHACGAELLVKQA